MPLIALLAAVVAVALLAPPAPAEAGAAQKSRARLQAFDSCSGLVRYARRNAVRNARSLIVPRGRGGQDESGAGGEVPTGAPVQEQAGGGAEDFSRTNVQEAGVDEPDIVKTDGSHLYAIAGGALHVVDVRAATPTVVDSMKLGVVGYAHELLLHGDRLLVLSHGGAIALGAQDDVVRRDWLQTTRLTELDVSRPGRLRVIRTLDVEGAYLSARLAGETARVVLTSTPRVLTTSLPQVRRARLARWIPRAVLTSRVTGRKRASRVVRCRAVRRTASFSGLDMVTVLTIDMARGLPAVDADSLMTDADTVYASTGSLYIATQRWIDPLTVGEGEPPAGMRTAIHRFEAAERGTTTYRSSGEVRGFVLSQWALSEHAGHLRVASTKEPDWWGGAGGDSESYVTVLREAGNRLAEVGRAGGLGRGEQIYAVRFIGDVGYVVTFRRVDPLYTLDLSVPTAPKVLGELKIRGYSAYLHPVGENLLLGVGVDATAEGRRLGTQVSLFDVSDLRNPVRLHQRALAFGSYTEVEYDHRAFLYWPATGLAVIPIEAWDADRPFFGATGLRVERGAGITEVGRIVHPAQEPFTGQIRRALVVGDRLFTVSDSGVVASPLDTLRDGAWLKFPQ